MTVESETIALTLPIPKRKRRRRRAVKISWRFLQVVVVLFACVAIPSYLTNPFTRFTTVQDPFITILTADGQLHLIAAAPLQLRTSPWYVLFGKVKAGYHIAVDALTSTHRTSATNLDSIIAEIHHLRFNPDRPYLISGDHFSVLYPRSLSIFYGSILDPRTALNTEDWLDRERIYLQTTAYALSVYEQAAHLSTTIVPVGEHSVSLINIYNPPSDTLYSLLFALDSLQHVDTVEKTYPFSSNASYALNTQSAAQDLLTQHHRELLYHLHDYLSSVVDPKTGLVKKNILLSSARDGVKRQSAFYDNVVLWKTQQLAQSLGLVQTDTVTLDNVKQKIIHTYWSEKIGCFLDDQSAESITQNTYASDWLIVLQTQFLNPLNADEAKYYEGCVKYVQQQKLDQPFGLRYQPTAQKNQEYWIVKLFASGYGATNIWSHLGAEYMKSLVLLYDETHDPAYLATARQQLNAYTQNILKYKCYPEVYDQNGQMYQTWFYKSVCQTGWVVSYEQAQKMVAAAE